MVKKLGKTAPSMILKVENLLTGKSNIPSCVRLYSHIAKRQDLLNYKGGLKAALSYTKKALEESRQGLFLIVD